MVNKPRGGFPKSKNSRHSKRAEETGVPAHGPGSRPHGEELESGKAYGSGHVLGGDVGAAYAARCFVGYDPHGGSVLSPAGAATADGAEGRRHPAPAKSRALAVRRRGWGAAAVG